MTPNDTEDELIENWRKRAEEITAEERQSTEYWKGVRAAYKELADELEEARSDG